MTVIKQRSINERLTRAAVLCLIALAAVLFPAREARAQWTTSGTTTTTTGNVGIGTPTPAQMFHVHSIGTWAGTRVTTAATGSTINDGVHFGYDDHYGAYIWNREANSVVFATSNTEKMRVDAAGNVGIGTATPSARLHATAPTTSVNTMLLLAPNPANTYYAGNDHDTLFIDGSGTSAHGMYTSRAFRLMRVRSSDSVDTLSMGRYGDLDLTPRTGTTAHTLRLSPDTGNGYYSGQNHDILLINGAGSNAHGLYSGSTLRLMRIVNAAGGDAMTIGRDGNTAFGGNVGVGTAAPASKLHVAGDIRVDGNISAKYQDVAEWVPSTQKLNAGTVVILDIARDNHVTASSTPYDTRVAGVVSAQPGLSLGEAGEGKALVATTGRVKVKVDATRAPIRVGDLLVTSETPGVAMRSEPLDLGGVPIHRPGTLIGKALESLEKGTGEILVLLSLQ